jgi:hypothetical protein
VSGVERSVSPISPDPTLIVNRISQEEEGIGEAPVHVSSRGPFGPIEYPLVFGSYDLFCAHHLPTRRSSVNIQSSISVSANTTSYCSQRHTTMLRAEHCLSLLSFSSTTPPRRLFQGNFVLDNPVPNKLLDFGGIRTEREFTYALLPFGSSG